MKNKKTIIISIISVVSLLLITLLSVTYARYVKGLTGYQNNKLITGNIYMGFNGNPVATNGVLRPMTKSEALEREDNEYEFVIVEKNTSSGDGSIEHPYIID